MHTSKEENPNLNGSAEKIEIENVLDNFSQDMFIPFWGSFSSIPCVLKDNS